MHDADLITAVATSVGMAPGRGLSTSLFACMTGSAGSMREVLRSPELARLSLGHSAMSAASFL